MNTRSLYDITGNITDYNDAVINRYELKQLHATIEQLQLQLAACLAVAEADTEESAKQARLVPPDHWSPACDAIAHRVDELIRLSKSKTPIEEHQIPDVVPGGIYDCLADPWDQGYGDQDHYRSIRADVIRIVRAVEKHHGITSD